MSTASFTIVTIIIFVGLILMMVLTTPFEPTVKAGKADKYCPRYGFMSRKAPEEVECDNKLVDVSGLKTFKAKGGSMSYCGVKSNHRIYVEIFRDEQSKNAIETYPVVVFSMHNVRFGDSQYKLRKFIDYVSPSLDNWHKIYEKHHKEERIKIDFDGFESSMKKKSASAELKNSDRYVLSETYNELKKQFEYSLHPTGSLYGKVLFAE